jgi:hypothetical protein
MVSSPERKERKKEEKEQGKGWETNIGIEMRKNVIIPPTGLFLPF